MDKTYKLMTILRGIPGSGKSTYIKQHCSPSTAVCSADHYFIHYLTGRYRFDASMLSQAHKLCYANAEQQAWQGHPHIVIDNTNTRVWEMEPYIRLAKEYGYQLEVVRLECPPEIAAKRCVHGVPADKIKAMADRMEKYQGEKVYQFSTQWHCDVCEGYLCEWDEEPPKECPNCGYQG